MTNENKIPVLISGLEERYKSIHIIRNRVHTTSIWLLGILLGVSGWIIKTNMIFSCNEKIYFIIITIVAWIFIILFYYKDLEAGFISQRKVAGKLEKELGFFDTGNLIYPKSWETGAKGKFFRNNYILIAFGFVSLIITLVIFI